MFANATTLLLGSENAQKVAVVVSLNQPRPFVYRQLVPMLARLLMSLHISAAWSLVIIVTLAGIGYYLALRKLAGRFYQLNDKNELLIVGLTIFTLPLLFNSQQVYDLPTAFLFTLSIYCLVTGAILAYLLVFAVACLNRETAFLLILVSLGLHWRRSA